MKKKELFLQAQKYKIKKSDAKQFIDIFSEKSLEYIDKLGFIMFTPDAFENDYVNQVLSYLNVEVLNYKLLCINERDAEKVYENELYLGKIDAWWIKKEIFSKGYSLVLLVKNSKADLKKSMCEYLLSKKGKSDPSLCEEASIRGRYRVTSKAFGFMHSSDDEFSVIKEASYFFSIMEIQKAINDCKNSDEHNIQEIFVPLKKQYNRINFYEILFGVKKLIWNNFYKEGIISENDNIKSIYENVSKIIDMNYPFTMEKRKITPFLWKEIDFINSKKKEIKNKILKNDFTCFHSLQLIASFRLLYSLADEQNFVKINLESIENDLLICNIRLDKWEYLILRASLFFYK